MSGFSGQTSHIFESKHYFNGCTLCSNTSGIFPEPVDRGDIKFNFNAMLSLVDFKKFEVVDKKKITGGFYYVTYTCKDGSGGFSTIGPHVNHQEILNRCGYEGATWMVIYNV